MSYELNYDADADCVVLRVEGKVTIGLIAEIAPEVARAFEETGCRRLLNDMSRAQIDVSAIELYRSPEIMDKSGVSRRTKRALVTPVDFDMSRFLETVSRNRGHGLRVFTDIEEARAWLVGEA